MEVIPKSFDRCILKEVHWKTVFLKMVFLLEIK